MWIGIVADDLTGAADAVAPFARHGMRADLAYVVRGKLRGDLEESDARAWDTETRVLPPETLRRDHPTDTRSDATPESIRSPSLL